MTIAIRTMPRLCATLTATAFLLVADLGFAFCGFYVAGADAKLFNDATMVVMMREGKHTALSMQNNYQGPPQDFAMVVPVPVVLQEKDVKTLPHEVFERIDQLAAPRLVEYWELDPCIPQLRSRHMMKSAAAAAPGGSRSHADQKLGVKIEAKFAVGEYKILILSAIDSPGLATWLGDNNYRLPQGASELLRPYVQQGSKFFVAKVDINKVKRKDGRLMLSPLRVHYQSKDFALPVRLGLMNSSGKQDLIVHILAKNQRYDVANYTNVTIPTNIDVKMKTKNEFGRFYTALFDQVLSSHQDAVITEYSWSAASCDPCPTPPLRPDELALLGADVMPSSGAGQLPASGPGAPVRPPGRRFGLRDAYVLTRLHARYGKDSLSEDLVFRAADPIVGGREFSQQRPRRPQSKTGSAQKATLEQGARPGSVNNFQARYAVRHEWQGPIRCKTPIRGRWGGPPSAGRSKPTAIPAVDLAFARKGPATLTAYTKEAKPALPVLVAQAAVGGGSPPEPAQIQLKESQPAEADNDKAAKTGVASAQPPQAPPPTTSTASPPPGSSCGACAVGSHAGTPAGLGWLGLWACVAACVGVRRRWAV